MNRLSSGPDLFHTGSHAASHALVENAIKPENIVLAGPPGSGKSTLGSALASHLGRPFISTDDMIEKRAGCSIKDIFRKDGEEVFRQLEAQVCREASAETGCVIAVGGGALLDTENRAALEAGGSVVMLHCNTDELIHRVQNGNRPLLGSNPAAELSILLDQRHEHYHSFPLQIDVSGHGIEASVSSILQLLDAQPAFNIQIQQDPPTQLLISEDSFTGLDSLLRELELTPPFTVISDTNTGPLYGHQIAAHLGGSHFQFPAGEQHKTLSTLSKVYDHLHAHRMERRGTIVAVGGGVVGDLAGTAAATYLRGIRWINAATSLLAMVDSSLGGKVAVDLPQGKNMVGAFHNPALILSDTRVLNTLPEEEFRCGMAELIKAAVIADPLLFEWLERGARPSPAWIQRAVQVKARIVEEDPFEQNIRASLNLGHTIGHSIELSSRYSFTHGEAVAVGMLTESMIAEKLGIADNGLTERIRKVIQRYGLPGIYTDASPEILLDGLKSDKKNVNGYPQFVLPIQPGEVKIGCKVPSELVLETLSDMQRSS